VLGRVFDLVAGEDAVGEVGREPLPHDLDARGVDGVQVDAGWW